MTNPEQPQSLAEARGEVLTTGERIGSEWGELSRRIPDLPTMPGGHATPSIAAALDEAEAAIQAADDVITEPGAYELLHATAEDLAGRAYQRALSSGDKKATYDADRFRADRIRVEVEFNAAVSAARAAVGKAAQVIKAESGGLVEPANQRLLAAGAAWQEAHAAANAAKAEFARLADQRAELLIATQEYKTFGVVNAESILRNTPASASVIGPVNPVPHEAATAVFVRLISLGAEGLDDLIA
jgi:hypothetical protein